MKRLKKLFLLSFAFISTFMMASMTAHADLIYDESDLISETPNPTSWLDVIIDPADVAADMFLQILPYVIIVVVLILTALLVNVFLKKKKRDSERKDDEIE